MGTSIVYMATVEGVSSVDVTLSVLPASDGEEPITRFRRWRGHRGQHPRRRECGGRRRGTACVRRTHRTQGCGPGDN